MRAARGCFLASSFLSAAAIAGLSDGMLTEVPDLRVVGGDANWNCYANEVYYPMHPCACALGTDSTHIYDFCSDALPENDSGSVAAPNCVTCAGYSCSNTSLSCGDVVWNCWNPQGTNKCNGGPYNDQWRTVCQNTQKPGGCQYETYTGCVDGTGVNCPPPP